ncbi:efflux RND transporter permease subunit [Viscerimonas tarda]
MAQKFKISSFSIILTFVCLTIVGLAFIPRLPVKLAPSQVLPQVNISFTMPGSSPLVVEMEATSKLEAMFNRMKGIQKISSSSGNGTGNITLSLDKHADIDAVRFEVSTIVRQTWAQLPKEVNYPSISLSRSDNESTKPFLNYTIISPASPISIQQFTEDRIKNSLSQIEGVYQINISGANPLEWQLEYDYHHLESLGITTGDIRSAIDMYLKKEFLGIASTVSANGEKQWIRLALASNFQQADKVVLDNIEIKNINGKIIYLKDIVTISRAESQPNSYYRINGKNTIYMSVIADETANQLELGNTIKGKLNELQAGFPAGYEIQLSYDATDYIKDELNKIYFRSGLTILILLLFVLFAYRSLKYSLLITLSLFINLVIAVIFYYIFQLEIQLYSLAGITISLTLVIDNTIVMSDQIIHRKNKQAFLAILTATITTIAALSIIFFLDEKTRLNLKDFAAVLIINLSISLLIALFLIPALIDKLKIGDKPARRFPKIRFLRLPERIKKRIRPKRMTVYFYRFYAAFCRFTWRRRIIVVLLVMLLFGFPVFLLPDKLEGESRFDNLYNETLGSSNYKENIKQYVDMALGGTWRLFAQKVYEGSYFTDRGEETSLFVTATLPHGATVPQLNGLIQKMEAYIAQYAEVMQFETSIMGANRASISIRFTKEHQQSNFPHILKSNLVSKSLELGGGSWAVYGVGDGFSNDVKEQAGSYRVEMFGFNYDELLYWAEDFKAKLLKHRRIKDVTIGSEFSWYKTDYMEFTFDINKERLAQEGIQPMQLFSAIKPIFEKRVYAGQLLQPAGLEQIVLNARQSKEYNVWDMNHIPVRLGEKEFKLSELVSIEKRQAPQKIAKENQQYRLCLQYEYIGAYQQGNSVLEKNVEEFQAQLPIGYTVKNSNNNSRGWGKEQTSQYWLLALVFVIIYFCSGILFNSLKQPFYVIFIIPISFVGIFLTFYWFKLNFDQGGFAAFILLSGLTVNANIYILNEYNNILKSRKINPLKAYIKAWNAKIRPILLTIISTILGFIPFMAGYKEGFWFPLAAGTIGGLIVSFIATFCFLPLFMGVGRRKKNRTIFQKR